jgi:hypothetical protein
VLPAARPRQTPEIPIAPADKTWKNFRLSMSLSSF